MLLVVVMLAMRRPAAIVSWSWSNMRNGRYKSTLLRGARGEPCVEDPGRDHGRVGDGLERGGRPPRPRPRPRPCPRPRGSFLPCRGHPRGVLARTGTGGVALLPEGGVLTLPEGGVLRLLREDLDEEEDPPRPSPPAPAATPVGVQGTAGLGLERLEAALPTPAGDYLAGDGRVLNNRPMSAASHSSKASSMSPWFPLSRISRRMLGDTIPWGEPRLEADDPPPRGSRAWMVAKDVGIHHHLPCLSFQGPNQVTERRFVVPRQVTRNPRSFLVSNQFIHDVHWTPIHAVGIHLGPEMSGRQGLETGPKQGWRTVTQPSTSASSFSLSFWTGHPPRRLWVHWVAFDNNASILRLLRGGSTVVEGPGRPDADPTPNTRKVAWWPDERSPNCLSTWWETIGEAGCALPIDREGS